MDKKELEKVLNKAKRKYILSLADDFRNLSPEFYIKDFVRYFINNFL